MFELIEQEPARLREVSGIGLRRAVGIIASWAEKKVTHEIMLLLHAHGVGTSRAVRIYKNYGAEAVQVITDNSYRLARDIRGISLRTADLVAQKLGIEPTASIRVRAGISFALAGATGEGRCGLPVQELTTLGGKLLAEVSADNGFCSEANLAGLVERKVRGYIATRRAKHPSDNTGRGRSPLTSVMRRRIR